MKLLVIGSGGREHALAWRLAKTAGLQKIYVAPGNAGRQGRHVGLQQDRGTVRLDEGHAANYVLRSVSGRVIVDGVKRSSSGPTNWVDSEGELSGSFVDVRANSVSGAITVLRRVASVPHTAPAEVDSPRADEEV